jgi:hypothetical protein
MIATTLRIFRKETKEAGLAGHSSSTTTAKAMAIATVTTSGDLA